MITKNFGYVEVEDPKIMQSTMIDITDKYKGEELSDDLINYISALYNTDRNAIQVTTGMTIMDCRDNRLWFFIDDKKKIVSIQLERFMPESKYLINY